MITVLACDGDPGTLAACAAACDGAPDDVVTLTLDLGQSTDVESTRSMALAGGAVRAHVLDAREAFVRDVILPALSDATVDDAWFASPAAAAPVWAAPLAEVARMERARAIIRPPDRPTRAGSAPHLLVRPAADRAHRMPGPAHLDLLMDRGVPVSINGVDLPLVDLIECLSVIAGHHGIGHENRPSVPAVVVLREACRRARAFEAPVVVRFELIDGRASVVGVRLSSSDPLAVNLQLVNHP